MDTWILSLFGTTLIAQIAQGYFVFRRLGSMETALRNACPFGSCPLFNRAKTEAAPQRAESQP